MNSRFFRLGICALLLLGYQALFAQPFANDIRAFKKQDSVQFPPQHAILFIGSSSFTNWKDVQDYFPGYPIINRGFGGSSLPDLIRYSDDIIFPYHPKQIVIYCGDNDLAISDTVSSETVVRRFETLFSMIRKKMPGVNMLYVSIKPSPSRARLKAKAEKANAMIRKFIASQENITYIDVYHPMLGSDGKPIPEIFREDSLHMNAGGYAIWQKLIQPYLAK
ncbi:MAG: GDSL-type esterase/lipase family protein [Chitinophagales bacterium]